VSFSHFQYLNSYSFSVASIPAFIALEMSAFQHSISSNCLTLVIPPAMLLHFKIVYGRSNASISTLIAPAMTACIPTGLAAIKGEF
jgi:hypothetical protein